MAKLRLQADLILDDEDPQAAELFTQLEGLAGSLRKIEGKGRRTERSKVELHRCFHDEEDPPPCEVLDSWEKS